MRKRSNPWPAFVDLFAALLITMFVGFIIMSLAIDPSPKLQTRGDSTVSIQAYKDSAKLFHRTIDSLLDKYTGSGVGNCLGSGYLADIYINGKSIRIVICSEIDAISDYNVMPGRAYDFSMVEFKKFGRTLLQYAQTQIPECRFPVRLHDSDQLTKDDFKEMLKLCNDYFYAKPVD